MLPAVSEKGRGLTIYPQQQTKYTRGIKRLILYFLDKYRKRDKEDWDEISQLMDKKVGLSIIWVEIRKTEDEDLIWL